MTNDLLPDEIYINDGCEYWYRNPYWTGDGNEAAKYIRAAESPIQRSEEILLEALKFYAKKEHWMPQTENSDARVLVAHGQSSFPDGWSEAHGAFQRYAIAKYHENGSTPNKPAEVDLDAAIQLVRSGFIVRENIGDLQFDKYAKALELIISLATGKGGGEPAATAQIDAGE